VTAVLLMSDPITPAPNPQPAPVGPTRYSSPTSPSLNMIAKRDALMHAVTVPQSGPSQSINSSVLATPTSPSPLVISTPKPESAPASQPVEVTRTPARVHASHCTKPEYPPASRRKEEEGTVELKLLVGIDGQVIQSEIVKSSGHPRLDEAAKAGLARCRFQPATVDGKPEPDWATLRYTWRLE